MGSVRCSSPAAALVDLDEALVAGVHFREYLYPYGNPRSFLLFHYRFYVWREEETQHLRELKLPEGYQHPRRWLLQLLSSGSPKLNCCWLCSKVKHSEANLVAGMPSQFELFEV